MPKKEITASVYNPSDIVEKGIQDSYHHFTNDWLNKYECNLIAKAIYWFKEANYNWLSNIDILNDRIKYFFNPQLSRSMNHVVLVIHPLFLRDILENNKISFYNSDPIVFVSKSIAHFFLKHFPVHVVIDSEKLKSINPNTDHIQIGSFLIFDEDINLDKNCIVKILFNNKTVDVNDFINGSELEKAAVVQIQRGIFKIDEDKRDISPEYNLWDKITKTNCKVHEVEPSQTGKVTVIYQNGNTKSIGQEEFDLNYIKI